MNKKVAESYGAKMVFYRRLKKYVKDVQGVDHLFIKAVFKVKLYQGGLNKKEIQLNLCNIFSILIFSELNLLT